MTTHEQHREKTRLFHSKHLIIPSSPNIFLLFILKKLRIYTLKKPPVVTLSTIVENILTLWTQTKAMRHRINPNEYRG